jgi:hypothetical protein
MSFRELLANSPSLNNHVTTADITVPANATTVIPFNTVVNTSGFGSSYNTTTGVFTAPVKGVYHFNMNMILRAPVTGAGLSSRLQYDFQYGPTTTYTKRSGARIDPGQLTASSIDYPIRHAATIFLNAGDSFRVVLITTTYGIKVATVAASTSVSGSSNLSIHLVAEVP